MRWKRVTTLVFVAFPCLSFAGAEETRAPEAPLVNEENLEKVQVSETIIIDEPGDYDFSGFMHEWVGPGACNQQENQAPILKITASNVTVRNFFWKNAPDGIHVHCKQNGQGNFCEERVENVKLINFQGNACEDLLTTGKNTFDVQIIGGVFSQNPNESYRDKTLQLNFANNLVIDGAYFNGGERCIRTKSGANLTVTNSIFNKCKTPFKGDTGEDIQGIVPFQKAKITSKRNNFYTCNKAFSAADAGVKYTSINDSFHSCAIGDATLH